MSKFISAELGNIAFERLSSRNKSGKAHLERTSALMYFLAFDMACKKLNCENLDLKPRNLLGNNNRKLIENNYVKLILIEKSYDSIVQVLKFGELDFNGKDPEKRISSNFFSTQLKRASNQKETYPYPKRPDAPVLKLGQVSKELKYGITYHNSWFKNFPKLLSEIKEPTPHIDLAIFLLRNESFEDEIEDLLKALKIGLRNKLTKNVAEYFAGKFTQEKLFAKHILNPFKNEYFPFMSAYKKEHSFASKYQTMNKTQLIDRIKYLEQTLKINGITL